MLRAMGAAVAGSDAFVTPLLKLGLLAGLNLLPVFNLDLVVCGAWVVLSLGRSVMIWRRLGLLGAELVTQSGGKFSELL